jgi:hypothetical protein
MFVAMLDWTQCAAVERVAGKVSGAWVFKTTRVPVRAFFENLENGAFGTPRRPIGHFSSAIAIAGHGHPEATLRPPSGHLVANR